MEHKSLVETSRDYLNEMKISPDLKKVKTLIKSFDSDEIDEVLKSLGSVAFEAYKDSGDKAWLNAFKNLQKVADNVKSRSGN